MVSLPESLLERLLPRLGLRARPNPTLDALRAIYGSWCQRIPFDNVRKLIHVRSGAAGPLPGSTPAEFLQAWLRFGTGGTCWSGAGALHALLDALGFAVVRGIGTMLAAPDLPPNHGTVIVTFGSDRYLVDSAILHGEPLLLDPEAETSVAHPAWGVRCGRREDGRWRVVWRALNKLDGFECRLERFGATHAEYDMLYERTRGWSPFNYELTARVNRGERVIGAAFGRRVALEADGSVHEGPLESSAERDRILIEEFGMSEEIVRRLPPDIPTPPPPGSRAAAAATEA